MAELHLTDPQPNGVSTPSSSPAVAAAGTVKSETLSKKRQRRPSVRLGEIGGGEQQHHSEVTASSNPRRANPGSKVWKAQYNLSNQSHQVAGIDYKKDAVNKVQSKTRALTNLTAEKETLDEKEFNFDGAAIGSWKGKESKKRVGLPNTISRRARSSWGKDPKFDDPGGGGGVDGGDDKYSGGEDMEREDGGYNGRAFNAENSDSPLEEENMVGIHINPIENLGDGNERYGKLLYYDNRRIGGFSRYSTQSHHQDGVEFSGPSDNDGRDYGNNHNAGCSGGGGEDAVRIWLNSIGLGRYAPVFEVHEVDDEVLPLLTLEDLKDMGISAVGSRRKMFCAIQKLGRGFS